MEWNVFYHDVNSRIIKTMNIFDHYNFKKDVQKDLCRFSNKNEFAKALRSNLMYYFWCKAEYEVLISPWCKGSGDKEVKVDIYTQVMNNWHVFLDYVWNTHKAK